jgi:myo-inositol-1(or 4)-monophosphatase
MDTFSQRGAHDAIVTLVREAGVMLRSSDTDVRVSYKRSDVAFDVVTNVDTAIDSFLRMRLKELFPTHHIYSEEQGGANEGDYVWTIDPIDGSSNFSRGIPHCAIVVGLLVRGVPHVGVVHNPYTNAMFSYCVGEGAFSHGEHIGAPHVRSTLEGSTLLFTIGSRASQWEWGFPLYKKLVESGARVRNFGSSALDFCFAATGRVDAVIYGGVSLFDIAPAVGMIRECGGEVVHVFDGTPAELHRAPQPVVASLNRQLIEEIRAQVFRDTTT